MTDETLSNRSLRALRCMAAISALYRLRWEMIRIGMKGCAEYDRLQDAIVERCAEIHYGED